MCVPSIPLDDNFIGQTYRTAFSFFSNWRYHDIVSCSLPDSTVSLSPLRTSLHRLLVYLQCALGLGYSETFLLSSGIDLFCVVLPRTLCDPLLRFSSWGFATSASSSLYSLLKFPSEPCRPVTVPSASLHVSSDSSSVCFTFRALSCSCLPNYLIFFLAVSRMKFIFPIQFLYKWVCIFLLSSLSLWAPVYAVGISLNSDF